MKKLRCALILIVFIACNAEKNINQPTNDKLKSVVRAFISYNRETHGYVDVCLLTYFQTYNDSVVYQLTTATRKEDVIASKPQFASLIDSVWVVFNLPHRILYTTAQSRHQFENIMNSMHFREGTIRGFTVPAWKLCITADSIYIHKNWGDVINAAPLPVNPVLKFEPPIK